MLPRLIRLRDAPAYLGMDKNRFNNEVRAYLMVIPIGEHGIAFDRIDLDAWVDHYKSRSGRPAERRELWDENASQAWSNATKSGISTKKLTDSGFAKALEQAICKKQSAT